MKSATLAAIFLTTAIATTGVAMAATHHHANAQTHEKYAAACSVLSGQWSNAVTNHGHNRHLGQAKHQERIGARDCRSNKTAELKAGVMHYRTALRTIGVRPSA
jgi:hypothetical protein